MKFNTIKRTTKNVIIVLMAGLFVSSCSDYLDVVPDNVPTLAKDTCSRVTVICPQWETLLRLLTFRGRMSFILVK